MPWRRVTLKELKQDLLEGVSGCGSAISGAVISPAPTAFHRVII